MPSGFKKNGEKLGFKKGNKINLGKYNTLGKHWKLSDKTKEKMRKAKRNISDETKKKMSLAKKGKPKSEEHKKNISKSLIGHTRNKGKHWKWKKPKKKYRKYEHLTGLKYKQWRLAIFTRDNFTCMGCQKVGGYLEAHHIKGWAKYSKLRYKINNGITLCKECHKLITF